MNEHSTFPQLTLATPQIFQSAAVANVQTLLPIPDARHAAAAPAPHCSPSPAGGAAVQCGLIYDQCGAATVTGNEACYGMIIPAEAGQMG